MLISRGTRLVRNVAIFATRAKAPLQAQIRHSGGQPMYRDMLPPNKYDVYQAELLGGLAWWWIFWHLWHDWGHIVGEFEYPDVTKWTDEELGIPPDDAEDPVRLFVPDHQKNL